MCARTGALGCIPRAQSTTAQPRPVHVMHTSSTTKTKTRDHQDPRHPPSREQGNGQCSPVQQQPPLAFFLEESFFEEDAFFEDDFLDFFPASVVAVVVVMAAGSGTVVGGTLVDAGEVIDAVVAAAGATGIPMLAAGIGAGAG